MVLHILRLLGNDPLEREQVTGRIIRSAPVVDKEVEMGRIDERLRELGITLPPTPKPLANYVPAKRVGALAFVAGQPSATQEEQITGQLGSECTVEDGQAATRLCLLNCLAALLTVVDSLDQVVQLVRIDGLLNSAPGFNEQSAVMNGASDLAVEIFGEAGRHVRSGAGVVGLPNNFTASVYIMAEVADRAVEDGRSA